MNRLANEKSPYLRHAAQQKIDWYPWSEEAFEEAKKQDKPVFLSSGAVWCHWCHVMAKENFERDEIADFLNMHFISIKLDRDERPDIDKRYQQAVGALGGGGGWPLTVFLLPDKKPFFGGTYFPPEDSGGRPGFQRVLETIVKLFKTKKKEIDIQGQKLVQFLKPQPLKKEEINSSIPNKEAIRSFTFFDYQNGGFGHAPKFPMAGLLQFLMNRHFFTQFESIGNGVKKTLEAMAKGGIHDQIGGGFHRYSVDESWVIPHFEKMADDNAWHLRNYIDAYRLFNEEYFKEVAEGIVRFLQDTLSAAEGGFYTSQNADVTPDDEGGYFTWSEDELKKCLTADEYSIVSLHYLHEKGSMHHDALKNVLFIVMKPEEIAQKTGKSRNDVIRIIQRGRKKLLAEREKRTAPLIDKTLYTDLNGMLITSFLNASAVLKNKTLQEFALRSLEKIFEMRFVGKDLFHTDGVKALLDDFVYLTEACLTAYEHTGDISYRNRAETVMNICTEKFWDPGEGGFFDTEYEELGTRLKNIEDVSHPSANALSIVLFLKLYFATGADKHFRNAAASLSIFLSRASEFSIHAGYYFAALDAYFHMLKLTVRTNPSHPLAQTALSCFYPYKAISYEDGRESILPCAKDRCYEPVETPKSLEHFLFQLRESGNQR